MTTTIETELTVKDFKGPVDPDWCAGCGDFGVLSSLERLLSSSKYNRTTWSRLAESAALPTCRLY